MEKVTAILICKEPEYPKIVLERLILGFFDEIIIEENCPHIYRRYELVKKAKNDIIYFQDSDCMVNYQKLFEKYNGRITNTMTLPFQKKYEEMQCTLIGWGAFFPQSMLSVFDRYIKMFGMDEHLYREADRIFTYLNKPFNTIIQPHENLPRASSNEAMYQDPNHFPSAYAALEKCKSL